MATRERSSLKTGVCVRSRRKARCCSHPKPAGGAGHASACRSLVADRKSGKSRVQIPATGTKWSCRRARTKGEVMAKPMIEPTLERTLHWADVLVERVKRPAVEDAYFV